MLGPVSSQMRPASARRRRQVAIVGDEGPPRARSACFDHRMAAAADDESEAVIDLRAHVIALDRELGQRRRDVDDGQRVGGAP